ncbi:MULTISPECIES: tRNA (adenosine(37)-N6)-threonylcarbamoyltransferase complex transferase subunit TsaD [unclassified Tenacibaculum]|uniref:tRNA (adenosine(37)-N6)-threonylcarbamoyltransferase complex transferase subunit TsaD n=1 Tax=unclassified Tenacibaculum TaxID=2635139 RepID=UPI001F3DDD8F|nr:MULTISPECIES: tRNA (adenosine(37)-N6)-threonylcarbamoyltransferase complex transferase subunit TsaD [unclassified Tenacibaculum]MCF2876276.1 tRNA (adenosine(37)-N6)-threonylcarbamoyltransferase complex transferase subunit TsaD [Tenacibaculum sp. Cn5-1]MCF2936351.1 tRNA (adenosine(37)-N6)-threonylcarbamoyltransferase complex transferase subunit TsaD [Tenacibaculum sp. Cn5-34]MCG7511694.1 tRNA (adenosine(37)-N6)-threonylcarbamoyltransferase complex transferase subunit TsaD [Tenacibaculum sp. Cn
MNTKNIYILGIESSCDDTSASVICNGKVLSNVIANQEVHAKYGGVVPELASRAHQQNIVPVVQQALEQANITKHDLNAIAFTRGPGLMGSLLVGTSFAKSLALGLNIPLIDVNHMQAHILAHFIDEEGSKIPPFPFICLTISGGHTQLVKITNHFEMEILGETIDDAVGEAFDKSAKILGLPYPGGPFVDKYAQLGNPKAFKFTKPKVGDLEFSFSGLKTGILYFIRKQEKENPNFIKENLYDICASIQHTIIEILMDKLKNTVKQTDIKHIAIAGGVSANSEIRKRLTLAEKHWKWTTYIPKFEYTTDNAAMIAIAGYLKYLNGNYSDISVTAQARLKVTE